MTAREINREIQNLSTGCVMRRTTASGFKVVVILGASRNGILVRMCVWSDNKRRWSQPQCVRPDTVERIVMHDITARQRAAATHAMRHIEDHDGMVTWPKGAEKVGRPWISKSSTKPAPDNCVTRLADVTLSAASSASSGWRRR